MAGRPKMMANKITELEAKTEEVFNLITEYIPKQYEMYEGRLEKASELCQYWKKAEFMVTDAMYAMGVLAATLRAKAGISDPADFERYPKIAKMREQGEGTQTVPCCEQGTNGDTEPMGAVDITKPS
ncbi:MAG: hypothetical protein IID41_11975 [Planctomycetes bacterium]|nr:hypothetical protein [Planctomycetota bacterium]